MSADLSAGIRAALVSGHCGVREMEAALRAVLALAPEVHCDCGRSHLVWQDIETAIAAALGVPR